jgi:hypothetical protein
MKVPSIHCLFSAKCRFPVTNTQYQLTPTLNEGYENAVKYFTDLMQWAAWTATPETTCTTIFIKQKLAEKRKLRKEWHLHRTPTSKQLFNRVTQGLKQLLHDHKNYNIQTFLNCLTPTITTDYSLWKTTKRLKTVTQTSTPLRAPQGTWARTNADKTQAFANRLASVFQPHPPEPDSLPEDTLTSFLETPFQLSNPLFNALNDPRCKQ